MGISKTSRKIVPTALAYVDPRYSVTRTLVDVFGGYPLVKKKHKRIADSHDGIPGRRAEIVSEKLCDDVIAYLAPSLEPYKGCILLDVHPGACVWSSKLHDYLKPKRHVLMEPEDRYFEPFIKPLLNKPGSAYRHSHLTGAHPKEYWQNYSKILDDPAMVAEVRPPLDPSDPKLRQLDTSILVTGNLFRRYSDFQQRMRNSDHVPLILHNMNQAALANNMFQRSGLVRSLWWMSDEKKQSLFSQNVRLKTSYTTGFSVGTTVTEVAGVNNLASADGPAKGRQYSRSRVMDSVIRKRVQERMTEANLRPPRDTIPAIEPELDSLPEDIDLYNKDVTATKCSSLQDLATAITDFENHILSLSKTMGGWLEPSPGAKILTREEIQQTIAYPQALSAASQPSSSRNGTHLRTAKMRNRAAVLIDNYLRIINLECEYAALAERHPSDPKLPSLRARILAAGDSQLQLEHEQSAPTFTAVLAPVWDDIIALYVKPSLLNRDARPYEPLKVDKTEVWPNYELALVDLVPKSQDIAVPDVASRREAASVCQQLLTHLYAKPSETIDKSLTKLAFNAAEDLIPMVPALCDARMGGRLDPTKAQVRMLGEEAIAQLVRAFLEWPFRPDPVQMALAGERSDAVDDSTAAPADHEEVLD